MRLDDKKITTRIEWIIGWLIAICLPIVPILIVQTLTLPSNWQELRNAHFIERFNRASPEERIQLDEERKRNIEQARAYEKVVRERLFRINVPLGVVLVIVGALLRQNVIGSGVMLAGVFMLFGAYKDHWSTLPANLANWTLLPFLLALIVTGAKVELRFLRTLNFLLSGFLMLGYVIGTQLSLLSYILLVILNAVVGTGLLHKHRTWLWVYCVGIIPASILAARNLSVLGREDTPSYFYTSPREQVEMVLLTIIAPFVLNIVGVARALMGRRFG